MGVGGPHRAWEGPELCFPACGSVRVPVTLRLRWPPQHPSRSEPGQVSPLSRPQSPHVQSAGLLEDDSAESVE